MDSSEFKALLKSATVITDEQRRVQVCERIIVAQLMVVYQSFLLACFPLQSSGPEHRVNPDKHRRADFLFPESTQDFDQLPLEFRVGFT